MWDDLKPITEETGQRILDAVSGVEDAAGENRNQGTGWNNLKPMTEETGRRILDAVAQSSRRSQEALDNRIKKFYTNNIGSVSVPDSDDGAIRNLVIGGKSEQLHTNGYQLLDMRGTDLLHSGISFKANEDGSIFVEGTASGDAITVPPVTLSLRAGTYIKSGKVDDVMLVARSTGDDGNVTFMPLDRFSLDQDTDVDFYLQVSPGVTLSTTYFPMLEAGSVSHDWEPYTGGAPSPSPEYPQEIKSVENCSMIVSNADGTETQTAPIPVTLRGIGDSRDELYVYADGTGKLVQRVAVRKIADVNVATESFRAVGANYRVWIDFEQPYRPAGYVLSKKKDLCTFLPCDADYTADYPHFYFDGGGLFVFSPASTKYELISNYGTQRLIYMLATPIETALTAEQVKVLFNLRTYYGGTNVSYESENGVEPVVNFDYACALENFVEYIKAAQGDDRKFIYDMDERMTDAEYVAAMAYVNSEYAAALTELEV